MRKAVVNNVVVVGGGIAGLCTAMGLQQRDIEVTVYEQAPVLGEVGAGLTLWPNAIKALRRLGVGEQVIAAGSVVERGGIRQADGRFLNRQATAELAAAWGAPSVGIHRAALHRELLAQLRHGAVKLDKACTGFQQDGDGVTVRFSDGSEARADLLVGADGIHSTVRQQLYPKPVTRYAGYTAWRGLTEVPLAEIGREAYEFWGCGRRFGLVRISDEQVYWFATSNWPAGRRLPTAAQKAWLVAHFGTWTGMVKRLIGATPAEGILHNDIYDLQPLQRWHEGRVVLTGDAAHATTPNMGQGACQAIESAVVLARCLGSEGSVEAALSAYGAARRGHTRRVIEQSRHIGAIAQWENQLACVLRNSLVRVVPDGLIVGRMAPIAAHNA